MTQWNRPLTRYHLRQQQRAQFAARQAVNHGLIAKKDACERCGVAANPSLGARGRIHGHHPDYSRPFFLQWLCVKCHRRVHATTPALFFFSKQARSIPARALDVSSEVAP